MRALAAICVIASLWASPAGAQPAPPTGASPDKPPLSRARVITATGLLIGGATLLAISRRDPTLPDDDRDLLALNGAGALVGGALTLALPRGASADPEPEPPPTESDERSRRKLWTGVGLTLGGALFFVQSAVLFPDGCRSYESSCQGALRAYRTIGGILTATGVTLILVDRAEERRGARVALGVAPGAVRVSVAF